ncbi:MAG: TatD family hydrolase [Patescibacteria group bacterium]|jgi:TatD DNase family protein
MFFDTHCHLNFEAFDGRVEEVINNAKKAGVDQIVIPGTDVPTSEKSIAIAEKYEGIYAAVGIHPHHIYQFLIKTRSSATQIFQKTNKTEKFAFASDLGKIETLMKHPKVVAIGEVGIDRHIYQKTKHQDYKINEEFVELQKEFLIEQIKLAAKYKKSLILHNREAKKDILEVLTSHQSLITSHSSVFHCCEPDPELLDFAKSHKMFIGVDGDITYYKEKQSWIKTIPLDMLVLETDSPYLSPIRQFPNEPKNIPLIAEFVAKLKGVSIDKLMETTTENAQTLFKVSP